MRSRSARNGEMNAVSTMRPASTNSAETSPMRRMFSCARLREVEVAVESVPDVVAVQQIGMVTALHQRLFQRIGDGGLARARQAREPQHRGFLALLVGADGGGDLGRLPHHVELAHRLGLRRDDHARAHRAEVQQVDDDERAGGARQLVVVDGDGFFQRDAHARQAVEVQRFGFARRQVVRRRCGAGSNRPGPSRSGCRS